MVQSIAKFFRNVFAGPSEGKNVFHPTEKCGDCGTPLMLSDEKWICPNPDCVAKIRERILHWCSPEAMDIAGVDENLVATFVSKGLVRDVAELYQLRMREIAALPGMDGESAQKLYDAIRASMKRDAWRVLFGLNISNLRAEEAQSLCRLFRILDLVFDVSAEQLMKADGVGEAAARNIVHWYGDPVNRKIVKRLFKAGVNFVSR